MLQLKSNIFFLASYYLFVPSRFICYAFAELDIITKILVSVSASINSTRFSFNLRTSETCHFVVKRLIHPFSANHLVDTRLHIMNLTVDTWCTVFSLHKERSRPFPFAPVLFCAPFTGSIHCQKRWCLAMLWNKRTMTDVNQPWGGAPVD